MAVSRVLRRLLRVLDIEEEQRRMALESGLGELQRLEDALRATGERGRRGRLLVTSSAAKKELKDGLHEGLHEGLIDRLAGLEETRAAMRCATALKPRIAEAERDVEELREEFLAQRVERRQAETLVEAAEARDAEEATRRGQQNLDDWYLNRFRRRESGPESAAEPAALAGSGLSAPGPRAEEGEA